MTFRSMTCTIFTAQLSFFPPGLERNKGGGAKEQVNGFRTRARLSQLLSAGEVFPVRCYWGTLLGCGPGGGTGYLFRSWPREVYSTTLPGRSSKEGPRSTILDKIPQPTIRGCNPAASCVFCLSGGGTPGPLRVGGPGGCSPPGVLNKI